MVEYTPAHTHATGVRSEIIACLWLLKQGFLVFRPITGVGPIDIVAVSKKGRVYLFDVKSITKRKNGRGEVDRPLTAVQKALGVEILYVNTETGAVSVRRQGRKDKRPTELEH